MSGLPDPPRVARGGLVLVEPRSAAGRCARSGSSTTPTHSRGRSRRRASAASRVTGWRPCGSRGPPTRPTSFDAEFDAADQLADPAANSSRRPLGLRPVLAALESGLYPSVGQLLAEDRMAGFGDDRGRARRGPADACSCSGPRAGAAGPADRAVGDRGRLRHPAATRSAPRSRSRPGVLTVDDLGFAHRGGLLYLAHQRAQERFAALVVRTPADLGLTSI